MASSGCLLNIKKLVLREIKIVTGIQAGELIHQVRMVTLERNQLWVQNI